MLGLPPGGGAAGVGHELVLRRCVLPSKYEDQRGLTIFVLRQLPYDRCARPHPPIHTPHRGHHVSTLFTPLTLRSLTIPNRVWMAPMCMYSAADQGPHTGAPTDFHLTHLASRAAGGTGLVMTEATAVRPDGRISPWDLGLWNDQQQQAFTRITRAIRDHGSVPAIQLAHTGRTAATDRTWNGGRALTHDQGGWTPVAPSAHAFEGLHHPHELTTDEITQLRSEQR